MKSTVKSFYSPHGVDLGLFEMTILTMAKIYRIYCLQKCLYGLEMLYISKTTLRELNTTQASLNKMNLKVSKYTKSSPLLDTLRIESIKNLYYKFKILFVKQLRMISFTNSLYMLLFRQVVPKCVIHWTDS